MPIKTPRDAEARRGVVHKTNNHLPISIIFIVLKPAFFLLLATLFFSLFMLLFPLRHTVFTLTRRFPLNLLKPFSFLLSVPTFTNFTPNIKSYSAISNRLRCSYAKKTPTRSSQENRLFAVPTHTEDCTLARFS